MGLIRLSLSGSVGWHASQAHPEAGLGDHVKQYDFWSPEERMGLQPSIIP